MLYCGVRDRSVCRVPSCVSPDRDTRPAREIVAERMRESVRGKEKVITTERDDRTAPAGPPARESKLLRPRGMAFSCAVLRNI